MKLFLIAYHLCLITKKHHHDYLQSLKCHICFLLPVLFIHESTSLRREVCGSDEWVVAHEALPPLYLPPDPGTSPRGPCEVPPALANCNELSFQWQSSPAPLHSPYLNKNKAYILTWSRAPKLCGSSYFLYTLKRTHTFMC